jgi:hypothetical protein
LADEANRGVRKFPHDGRRVFALGAVVYDNYLVVIPIRHVYETPETASEEPRLEVVIGNNP